MTNLIEKQAITIKYNRENDVWSFDINDLNKFYVISKLIKCIFLSSACLSLL